ncbi:MAG: type II secretion system protein [Candidatus Nitrotoga sp.]
MSTKQQKEVVFSLDASPAPRSLRRRFTKLQNKQNKFTLLELLVVISIITEVSWQY